MSKEFSIKNCHPWWHEVANKMKLDPDEDPGESDIFGVGIGSEDDDLIVQDLRKATMQKKAFRIRRDFRTTEDYDFVVEFHFEGCRWIELARLCSLLKEEAYYILNRVSRRQLVKSRAGKIDVGPGLLEAEFPLYWKAIYSLWVDTHKSGCLTEGCGRRTFAYWANREYFGDGYPRYYFSPSHWRRVLKMGVERGLAYEGRNKLGYRFYTLRDPIH